MSFERRCRGVRVTPLPQEMGVPVPARGVRVSQAIALPALAGARLPWVTSPWLPLATGAWLALALASPALAGALLALTIALPALPRARLTVAVPVRVPACAVRLGA